MVNYREAGAQDRSFLAAMLVEAVAWRPSAEKPMTDAVLSSPEFARYLTGWPRSTDGGVIAENESGSIAAAWYRLFDAAEHGYGYVADDVPELTIAVVGSFRGRGIGRALLQRIAAHAASNDHRALSLSVDPDNFALQLYESEGFEVVGRAGGSLTMERRRLSI